jgi:AraC family transcriptional activator of pobA
MKDDKTTRETQETVCTCNRLFDVKTLHPLVSVIDLSCKCKKEKLRLDSYSVIMRQYPPDEYHFGRRTYDFSDATLLFRSPDKVIPISHDVYHEQRGTMLVFHPDLLGCTPLGRRISSYTFFKYRPEEALHLSCCEMRVIGRCLDDVQQELKWGVDRYSAALITGKIEQLLLSCQRFYTRQFTTRRDADAQPLQMLCTAIDDYLTAGRVATVGLPCACHFAQKFNCSSAYLNDMLRQATGKSFSDYLQSRRLAIARQMVEAHTRSDAYIAHLLGLGAPARLHELLEAE